MERAAACLQFADDLLHARRHILKFLQLSVGIASESKRAVIGYADLVAIRQHDTLLAQHAAQRPDAVARHAAARNDGEDIRTGTDDESGYHSGHSGRQIEIVGREDQTDTLLVGQIHARRIYKRHQRFVQSLSQLACNGETIACCGKIK